MSTALQEIQRAVALLWEPSAVVELRIPKAGRFRTISGYYNVHQTLAQDATKWGGQFNVYVTLNRVRPDLLARSANKFTTYAEHTTKDEHIEHLRWLLVDADPIRPAGISSSDAEHEAAIKRVHEICEWLQGELGFPAPPIADSGNGGHILLHVDLPNTPESTELLKRCLAALAFRFNDEAVQVDQTTYNASRIVKLYGTLAVKGDSLPERPHRYANLLSVPDSLETVSLANLECLAATLPPEPPKAMISGQKNAFDVEGFITQHYLEVSTSGIWNNARKWSLRVCPFNPEHSRGEAYILQYPNGAIVAGCLHQSCRNCNGQTWRELREMYEPRQNTGHAVESVAERQYGGGQSGLASLTPARWFTEKFPKLEEEYGDAILEQTDKNGIVSARDIGEDFLAATLSDKACPDTPTVFISAEQRFFTYSQNDGIFVFQREPMYLAQLSRLLLECARACRGEGCETQSLEFRFRDSSVLSGVMKKARGLLEAPHDFFSTDLTEFIPCNNGMLRLSDRELLPFSPSYRRRNKLAVPFDESADCPVFLETLMRPALEPDDLDLLQRWCGLALIGENLAQKLLILTGTPGGGKGTFVRVLTGIIGRNNIASLRPHLLGERFETSRFLGKTLLYGADVPENFLNQRGASVLKSLTGYDPITLEFKNSNESPFIICKFNVIVTCNSRLTVHLEGDTDAWRRRLAIVDYHKPKPAHVIADLDEQILRTEAPGVLNWMLEGLYKVRADGWQLCLSTAQQESVDNLLLESDGHTLFVREALARGDSQLTVGDCFAAYVEYCSERGWVALTRNKFGQIIGDTVARHHGLTVRHDIIGADGKAQRGWRGLILKEENLKPTGKGVSETSESEISDNSDINFSLSPEKTATNGDDRPMVSGVPQGGPSLDESFFEI